MLVIIFQHATGFKKNHKQKFLRIDIKEWQRIVFIMRRLLSNKLLFKFPLGGFN
jgi:hypothetical protein